jgi:hypothetical protein
MADNTQIAVASIGAIATVIAALIAAHIIPIPWGGGGEEGSSKTLDPDTLSGRYSMDGNMGKIMTISHSSGNTYNVAQLAGDWPWQGTVTLNGGRLLGNCISTTSAATFVFEGTILGDRSIDGSFKYITDANGNPAGGRVDKHTFIPINE